MNMPREEWFNTIPLSDGRRARTWSFGLSSPEGTHVGILLWQMIEEPPGDFYALVTHRHEWCSSQHELIETRERDFVVHAPTWQGCMNVLCERFGSVET